MSVFGLGLGGVGDRVNVVRLGNCFCHDTLLMVGGGDNLRVVWLRIGDYKEHGHVWYAFGVRVLVPSLGLYKAMIQHLDQLRNGIGRWEDSVKRVIVSDYRQTLIRYLSPVYLHEHHPA